ncbi:MAG TPA: TIR domain-containing protein [Polyangiales bacterium]|nr:TIR domain-containing protein [Polyangiales bacterium]
MAGDRDLGCLKTLLDSETISDRDYLVWLGKCSHELCDPIGGEGPFVNLYEFGLNATQVTKGNAKAELLRLRGRYERASSYIVHVCAPLRYLDKQWWAFGATDREVHAFGLQWLLRELIPQPAGAHVVLHLFRAWRSSGRALPVDLPDAEAAATLAAALNRSGSTAWSCELKNHDEVAPHLRSHNAAADYRAPTLAQILRGRPKLSPHPEGRTGPLLIVPSQRAAAGAWQNALVNCGRALSLDIRVPKSTELNAAGLIVLDDSDLTHHSSNRELLAKVPTSSPVVLFGTAPADDAGALWRVPEDARGDTYVARQVRWLAHELGIVQRSPKQHVDKVLLSCAKRDCGALLSDIADPERAQLTKRLDEREQRGTLHEGCELMCDDLFARFKGAARNEQFWSATKSVLQLWRDLLTKWNPEAELLLAGTPEACEQLMQSPGAEKYRFEMLSAKTWRDQIQRSHTLLCVLDQSEEHVAPHNLREILAQKAPELTIMGALVPHKAAPARWTAEADLLEARDALIRVSSTLWMSDVLIGFLDDYFAGSTIFFSYASQDRSHVEQIWRQLKAMQPARTFSLWFDKTSLSPDDLWEPKLICARAAAGVAAIFTSAEYFSSEFARPKEYDPLIRARDRKDVKIAWLPIKPSAVHELATIQAIETTAVIHMSEDQRSGLFYKAAQHIADRGDEARAARQQRRFPKA